MKASIILSAFLLLLSSCAVRSVYIPVSQNVPLFDSTRTLNSSAYISTNHIELQAACNPKDHLALAGNINFGAGIAIYDFAAGLYSYSSTTKWRYELFGGYGYNANSSYQTNVISLFNNRRINYDVGALYHKFYLQPAIGFYGRIRMYKINYSFSLSTRLSYNRFKSFKYREIDVDNTIAPSQPVYNVDRTYNDVNILTIEPCITNKVGIKNLYAILQLQTITPSSKVTDLHYTRFSPGLLLSIGIQYNLKF